jgi:hypothetical protein
VPAAGDAAATEAGEPAVSQMATVGTCQPALQAPQCGASPPVPDGPGRDVGMSGLTQFSTRRSSRRCPPPRSSPRPRTGRCPGRTARAATSTWRAGSGGIARGSYRCVFAQSMTARIAAWFLTPFGRPVRRPSSCGGGTPRGGLYLIGTSCPGNRPLSATVLLSYRGPALDVAVRNLPDRRSTSYLARPDARPDPTTTRAESAGVNGRSATTSCRELTYQNQWPGTRPGRRARLPPADAARGAISGGGAGRREAEGAIRGLLGSVVPGGVQPPAPPAPAAIPVLHPNTAPDYENPPVATLWRHTPSPGERCPTPPRSPGGPRIDAGRTGEQTGEDASTPGEGGEGQSPRAVPAASVTPSTRGVRSALLVDGRGGFAGRATRVRVINGWRGGRGKQRRENRPT